MEEKTFDEVLTEFAKRDSAGFIVWGQKLESAHNREVDELRRRLKVAEDAISSASDAFRFCIEHCELELSPKMIGKLCDDGQACERALSFIREEGRLK